MGRSHALRLAEEGADLVLVDACAPIDGIGYPMSEPSDLAETVKEVEARNRRVLSKALDVRDCDALSAFVAQAAQELGGLDAWS